MTTMRHSYNRPALAIALTLSLLAAACSSGLTTSAPAATTAPAAAASGPVSNPPTTPQMVDSINIQGQKVEVTYWHNRPQSDQDLLQGMLDDFNRTNPYG